MRSHQRRRLKPTTRQSLTFRRSSYRNNKTVYDKVQSAPAMARAINHAGFRNGRTDGDAQTKRPCRGPRQQELTMECRGGRANKKKAPWPRIVPLRARDGAAVLAIDARVSERGARHCGLLDHATTGKHIVTSSKAWRGKTRAAPCTLARRWPTLECAIAHTGCRGGRATHCNATAWGPACYVLRSDRMP